jgi:hypothetical protein
METVKQSKLLNDYGEYSFYCRDIGTGVGFGFNIGDGRGNGDSPGRGHGMFGNNYGRGGGSGSVGLSKGDGFSCLSEDIAYMVYHA